MEIKSAVSSARRIRVYSMLLVVIALLFGVRLFYLQVIRSDYYAAQARSSQLKQYEIPAERGGIYAYDGKEIVPLVLNETRYRITADPEIVKDTQKTAETLSPVLGKSTEDTT
jgi:cell division protein FtsI/penicillin-binding protein 2